MNGSQSSDDLRVVNYTWTRESGSLAVGDILANTDRESILMVSIYFSLTLKKLFYKLCLQLTNIVPGHYVFKLTVTDDQGLTGTDTVHITVHGDKLMMNLVEVILTAQSTSLSQEQVSF